MRAGWSTFKGLIPMAMWENRKFSTTVKHTATKRFAIYKHSPAGLPRITDQTGMLTQPQTNSGWQEAASVTWRPEVSTCSHERQEKDTGSETQQTAWPSKTLSVPRRNSWTSSGWAWMSEFRQQWAMAVSTEVDTGRGGCDHHRNW